MKKVRISTLIGDYNYGNRLQNYALSKKISEKGFEVKTLNYQYVNRNIKNIIKRTLRNIVVFLKIGRYKRENSFRLFNKNIKFTKPIYSNDVIKTEKIDFFITGSDQVWNYNFSSFSERDLLTFSNYEKNIAYSASFGVEEITDSKKEMFIKGLNNIKHISVREISGAEIVHSLTNHECKVLIDPTMLLTKDEWTKLEKMPEGHQEQDYILLHVLGDGVDKDKLEKIFKMKIIQINNREDTQYYNCGPSEYLYLVNHAKLVITDSFHCNVFSILFEKPFVVYDRIVEGKVCMQGRINTLLSLFGKQDRRIKNIEEIEEKDNIFEIDTSIYNSVLEKERQKAENFLETALNKKGVEK